MLIAFCMSSAYSQCYIRAGGGYSFALSSTQIGERVTGDNISSTREAVYGSFGSGANGEGVIGAAIAEHLCVEIGLSYLAGAHHEIETMYGSQNYSISTTQNITAELLSIIPALALTTHVGGVDPYSRFGMIIGFPRLTSEISTRQSNPGTTLSGSSKQSEWGGLAIGFTGSLGVSFPIGKPAVYAEVRANTLVWNPTKWKIESGGTTREGEYEMKVSDTLTSSSLPDPLQPSHPFGSLGVVIGVLLPL